MKTILFVFLLTLAFQNFIGSYSQCIASQCTGCCADDICLNTTDVSTCQLSPNYNFSILIQTLIALAAFIIGKNNLVFFFSTKIFIRISYIYLCNKLPCNEKNFLQNDFL